MTVTRASFGQVSIKRASLCTANQSQFSQVPVSRRSLTSLHLSEYSTSTSASASTDSDMSAVLAVVLAALVHTAFSGVLPGNLVKEAACTNYAVFSNRL